MALHPYSVNDANNVDERTQAPYRIALLTSFVGAGITFILGRLSQWGIVTIVSAPSTLAIYLLLLKLVEKRLWRQSFVRLLLGISTPNLNGECGGALVAKRAEDGTFFGNTTARMRIQQSWRTISIVFETDRTKSQSDTASIIIGAGEVKVYYHYDARKKRAFDKFEDEFGSAELSIKVEDDRILPETAESDFFTNTFHRGQALFTQTDDVGSLRKALMNHSEIDGKPVEIAWVD